MPRRPRLQPDVEDVVHLCQAVWARRPQRRGRIGVVGEIVVGEKLLWCLGEPRVAAAFGKDASQGPHRRAGKQDLAVGVLEGRDGKTPRTLA